MNAISKIRANYDQLFIDGRFVASSLGTEPVLNPATGENFGVAPLGGKEEALAALAAARRAFDEGPWPQTDRNDRADAMQRLLDKVRERKEEALTLMMLEMGYTALQAGFLFGLGETQCVKAIEIARKDPTKTLPFLVTPRPDGTNALGGALVTRDPIGVVLAITPYNAGFLLTLLKALPAMAAGNSVIVKPSPFTPLQTMLVADMVAELDLPPGVFNVVTGGADVGAILGSDPRVDMVSFTGSDKIGSQIMIQAAPTLKKCHLELGGKSPLIIRHDADMERAVMSGIFGFVHQAGQGCSLTTRMLVDNRIRGDFVAALSDAVSKLKIGDPFAQDTFMGPLIRETARERTAGFCARALEEGATLVLGGKRPEGLDKGFFFEPTIFDNVTNESYLGQNEVFGPIAAVVGFDTDEEAVRLANQSDYGLGGAIISRDAGTALKMAMKVRTGQISINGGPGGFHPDTPFGGYKKSGLGREWGEEGFNEYTEIKAISFPAGN
ncbi:aldehyde dehydrogenase family protein [Sphingobium sp. Sx8-8]|uniref:aldehyde dehydrogenase family protein n=1 Tax=Sphingobium sp. Sx8-8 TaxID=2933617 RepID=UPI001F587115|nr:aldehyde dehydrogenase family protein [Sphingobium sp. Sx8-8]